MRKYSQKTASRPTRVEKVLVEKVMKQTSKRDDGLGVGRLVERLPKT